METEARRRRRVTVVDDDEDVLALMREILTGMGHEVATLDGRDMTVRGIVATRPDLLILDLWLPVGREQLTGVEVLELVRRHRALRKTPIVVCSADVRGLDEVMEHEPRIGRVSTVAKPFDLDSFEAAVRNAMAAADPA